MVETGSDIYVKLFQDTVIVIRIMFMPLHLLGISDAVNFLHKCPFNTRPSARRSVANINAVKHLIWALRILRKIS